MPNAYATIYGMKKYKNQRVKTQDSWAALIDNEEKKTKKFNGSHSA